MIDWLKQFRNYIFAFVMFNSSSYSYGWAKQGDGIFWWIVTISLLITGIYFLLREFGVVKSKGFDDD